MREATIRIPDGALDSLGLEEFVSTVRGAGLRQVAELQCQRPGCLLAVEVAGRLEPARLSSIDELQWWEELASGGGVTYLCKLQVPALEAAFDPHYETDVSEGDIEVTEGGIEVTMVGSQDAVSDRVSEYDETMGVLLRSLGHYEGPADPLDSLTDRQREVLRTAFEAGYFAVPREATTDEVAIQLDLEPSTVREHLQRAQHNLLRTLLDSG